MRTDKEHRIFYMVLGAMITITIFLFIFMIRYNTYSQQEDDAQKYRKEIDYNSSVEKNDCYLCGNNKNSTLFAHWGEQNIGLINLNTFECFVFDLNQYDSDRNLVEEKVRFGYRRGYQKWEEDGGSKVSFSYEMNRGYFTGRISIDESTPLQIDKLSLYVCTDCLNSIMEQWYYDEPYCDIGLIDFNTKSINVFMRNGLGLQLGDYQIVYRYDKDYNTYDFNGFYCPVRYSEPGFGYRNDSTVLGIIIEYCMAYQIPLNVDDELTEFLSGFIRVDSIRQTGDVIAFEELSNDGTKILYVYIDGRYEINDFTSGEF